MHGVVPPDSVLLIAILLYNLSMCQAARTTTVNPILVDLNNAVKSVISSKFNIAMRLLQQDFSKYFRNVIASWSQNLAIRTAKGRHSNLDDFSDDEILAHAYMIKNRTKYKPSHSDPTKIDEHTQKPVLDDRRGKLIDSPPQHPTNAELVDNIQQSTEMFSTTGIVPGPEISDENEGGEGEDVDVLGDSRDFKDASEIPDIDVDIVANPVAVNQEDVLEEVNEVEEQEKEAEKEQDNEQIQDHRQEQEQYPYQEQELEPDPEQEREREPEPEPELEQEQEPEQGGSGEGEKEVENSNLSDLGVAQNETTMEHEGGKASKLGIAGTPEKIRATQPGDQRSFLSEKIPDIGEPVSPEGAHISSLHFTTISLFDPTEISQEKVQRLDSEAPSEQDETERNKNLDIFTLKEGLLRVKETDAPLDATNAPYLPSSKIKITNEQTPYLTTGDPGLGATVTKAEMNLAPDAYPETGSLSTEDDYMSRSHSTLDSYEEHSSQETYGPSIDITQEWTKKQVSQAISVTKFVDPVAYDITDQTLDVTETSRGPMPGKNITIEHPVILSAGNSEMIPTKLGVEANFTSDYNPGFGGSRSPAEAPSASLHFTTQSGSDSKEDLIMGSYGTVSDMTTNHRWTEKDFYMDESTPKFAYSIIPNASKEMSNTGEFLRVSPSNNLTVEYAVVKSADETKSRPTKSGLEGNFVSEYNSGFGGSHSPPETRVASLHFTTISGFDKKEDFDPGSLGRDLESGTQNSWSERKGHVENHISIEENKIYSTTEGTSDPLHFLDLLPSKNNVFLDGTVAPDSNIKQVELMQPGVQTNFVSEYNSGFGESHSSPGVPVESLHFTTVGDFVLKDGSKQGSHQTTSGTLPEQMRHDKKENLEVNRSKTTNQITLYTTDQTINLIETQHEPMPKNNTTPQHTDISTSMKAVQTAIKANIVSEYNSGFGDSLSSEEAYVASLHFTTVAYSDSQEDSKGGSLRTVMQTPAENKGTKNRAFADSMMVHTTHKNLVDKQHTSLLRNDKPTTEHGVTIGLSSLKTKPMHPKYEMDDIWESNPNHRGPISVDRAHMSDWNFSASQHLDAKKGLLRDSHAYILKKIKSNVTEQNENSNNHITKLSDLMILNAANPDLEDEEAPHLQPPRKNIVIKHTADLNMSYPAPIRMTDEEKKLLLKKTARLSGVVAERGMIKAQGRSSRHSSQRITAPPPHVEKSFLFQGIKGQKSSFAPEESQLLKQEQKKLRNHGKGVAAKNMMIHEVWFPGVTRHNTDIFSNITKENIDLKSTIKVLSKRFLLEESAKQPFQESPSKISEPRHELSPPVVDDQNAGLESANQKRLLGASNERVITEIHAPETSSIINKENKASKSTSRVITKRTTERRLTFSDVSKWPSLSGPPLATERSQETSAPQLNSCYAHPQSTISIESQGNGSDRISKETNILLPATKTSKESSDSQFASIYDTKVNMGNTLTFYNPPERPVLQRSVVTHKLTQEPNRSVVKDKNADLDSLGSIKLIGTASETISKETNVLDSVAITAEESFDLPPTPPFDLKRISPSELSEWPLQLGSPIISEHRQYFSLVKAHKPDPDPIILKRISGSQNRQNSKDPLVLDVGIITDKKNPISEATSTFVLKRGQGRKPLYNGSSDWPLRVGLSVDPKISLEPSLPIFDNSKADSELKRTIAIRVAGSEKISKEKNLLDTGYDTTKDESNSTVYPAGSKVVLAQKSRFSSPSELSSSSRPTTTPDFTKDLTFPVVSDDKTDRQTTSTNNFATTDKNKVFEKTEDDDTSSNFKKEILDFKSTSVERSMQTSQVESSSEDPNSQKLFDVEDQMQSPKIDPPGFPVFESRITYDVIGDVPSQAYQPSDVTLRSLSITVEKFDLQAVKTGSTSHELSDLQWNQIHDKDWLRRRAIALGTVNDINKEINPDYKSSSKVNSIQNTEIEQTLGNFNSKSLHAGNLTIPSFIGKHFSRRPLRGSLRNAKPSFFMPKTFGEKLPVISNNGHELEKNQEELNQDKKIVSSRRVYNNNIRLPYSPLPQILPKRPRIQKRAAYDALMSMIATRWAKANNEEAEDGPVNDSEDEKLEVEPAVHNARGWMKGGQLHRLEPMTNERPSKQHRVDSAQQQFSDPAKQLIHESPKQRQGTAQHQLHDSTQQSLHDSTQQQLQDFTNQQHQDSDKLQLHEPPKHNRHDSVVHKIHSKLSDLCASFHEASLHSSRIPTENTRVTHLPDLFDRKRKRSFLERGNAGNEVRRMANQKSNKLKKPPNTLDGSFERDVNATGKAAQNKTIVQQGKLQNPRLFSVQSDRAPSAPSNETDSNLSSFKSSTVRWRQNIPPPGLGERPLSKTQYSRDLSTEKGKPLVGSGKFPRLERAYPLYPSLNLAEIIHAPLRTRSEISTHTTATMKLPPKKHVMRLERRLDSTSHRHPEVGRNLRPESLQKSIENFRKIARLDLGLLENINVEEGFSIAEFDPDALMKPSPSPASDSGKNAADSGESTSAYREKAGTQTSEKDSHGLGAILDTSMRSELGKAHQLVLRPNYSTAGYLNNFSPGQHLHATTASHDDTTSQKYNRIVLKPSYSTPSLVNHVSPGYNLNAFFDDKTETTSEKSYRIVLKPSYSTANFMRSLSPISSPSTSTELRDEPAEPVSEKSYGIGLKPANLINIELNDRARLSGFKTSAPIIGMTREPDSSTERYNPAPETFLQDEQSHVSDGTPGKSDATGQNLRTQTKRLSKKEEHLANNREIKRQNIFESSARVDDTAETTLTEQGMVTTQITGGTPLRIVASFETVLRDAQLPVSNEYVGNEEYTEENLFGRTEHEERTQGTMPPEQETAETHSPEPPVTQETAFQYEQTPSYPVTHTNVMSSKLTGRNFYPDPERQHQIEHESTFKEGSSSFTSPVHSSHTIPNIVSMMQSTETSLRSSTGRVTPILRRGTSYLSKLPHYRYYKEHPITRPKVEKVTKLFYTRDPPIRKMAKDPADMQLYSQAIKVEYSTTEAQQIPILQQPKANPRRMSYYQPFIVKDIITDPVHKTQRTGFYNRSNRPKSRLYVKEEARFRKFFTFPPTESASDAILVVTPPSEFRKSEIVELPQRGSAFQSIDVMPRPKLRKRKRKSKHKTTTEADTPNLSDEGPIPQRMSSPIYK